MRSLITTRSPAVESILEKSRKQREMNRKRELLIKENWRKIKDQGFGCTNFVIPPMLLDYGAKRMFYDVLPDGAWKSQRCFVVGGGPSLKEFDFSKLYGELTIGINRAFEAFDCTIMFCMDKQFYNWIMNDTLGIEAKKKFSDFKGYKVWVNPANYEFPKDIYLLNCSGGHDFTSSMREGLGSGANSGFSAVNLAACLGANPIYLLGFDMEGKDGKQAWWHDGYPNNQGDDVYEKFKASFNHVAPDLARTGIKIINLNPESALKCFEFGKFEDINPIPGYELVETYDSRRIIPHKNNNLLFKGCLGFGDNFYQRPIIKDVSKIYKTIYLMTCLPEIYWDIPNVKFIYPDPMNLRTHNKRIKNLSKETWSKMPANRDSVRWGQLGPPSVKIQTKYVELENRKDFDFTMPVKNSWVKEAKRLVEGLPLNGKKLCIVRRPTNRKEWNCPARNPKIEYYQLLINHYKDEYFFLGLADVLDGHEEFDGNLHGLDKEFNKGEIPLTTIFGLMKIADMTITYPSFFMIAAIAIRAKCFCIFGGVAGPEYLLRKNLGLQNFAYVAAEPFCSCHTMNHNCKKDIPVETILASFEELRNRPKYIKSVTVGVPPGMGDSYWVMTKMESFKEKNAIDELKIVVHRDSIHYYTTDFLRLLPFIDGVEGYEGTFQLKTLYDKTSPGCVIENTQGVDYLIDFGAKMWLQGMHLEDILPEYETNYHIPIDIPEDSREFASTMKKNNNGKLILFYTSSIGNNANWNGGAWEIGDWMSLAKLIFKHSGIRPILVGAEWDKDYAVELKRLDKRDIIQDFTGKASLPQTIGLIQNANLVVAFACGIPIIATYFGVPTVMFWAINGISRKGRFDSSFQFTWVPKNIKKSGRYVPVAYDGQKATPEWIFNKTKEFL